MEALPIGSNVARLSIAAMLQLKLLPSLAFNKHFLAEEVRKSFAQRQGIKPIKSIVQIDSMDDDLRNSLTCFLSTRQLLGEAAQSIEAVRPEMTIRKGNSN